jgi:glutamate--cysteine ligase
MNKVKAIKKIVQIFNNGIKNNTENLGVEFEHFIIDQKSLESCDYNSGVKRVMENLLDCGYKALNSDSDELLGLTKDNHYITLEPGGQLEVSLKPYKEINNIRKAYSKILDDIKLSLLENQRIISLGYHPKTKIEVLEILPKLRYHQMYEYFKSCGKYAHCMMKGTASTQVAIDYHSEEDFIKKFRVANFLSPFIYRIFDASPVFEGEIYENNNLRLNIWDYTDQSRCGIPKNALTKGEFNFNDYAEFIMNTAPIFIKNNKDYIFTGEKSLREIIQSEKYQEIDLEYTLGMVFPDTRLKGYIELRMPDALPYPLGLAVPALIKGIFYNKENLDKYYELSLGYDDEDYIKLKELFKESLNINYKGINSKSIINGLFKDAMKVLKENEITELYEIKNIINNYESVSKFLKKIYGEDLNRFTSIMTGGLTWEMMKNL